jgi:GH43 family beta-xylosidase
MLLAAGALGGCALQQGAAPSALAALVQPVSDVSFANPLVRQRADPQVSLHSDGYYYYTATVPEYDRIEVRRAQSLNELGTAKAQVVWRQHASGPMSYHIWAPEMHHIDGKWYIYFTAGRADAHWDIRLYVLENSAANPLEGAWVERGQLKTGWESFSLDATTFAVKGQRYLAWTQVAPGAKNHGTNIYLAKMDTPWSIVQPAVMVSQPEYAWEKVKHDVNEGPAALVRNGRVFLTYSASATDANYCLGMLTADDSADLLNPASWRKSPEPVLRSSEATGQYGPGHNAFTTTPDGKTDILVYHARNYRDIAGDPLKNADRHTRAQVIRWRADGTPDFGVPVADAARPAAGNVANKPLFRDPVMDGAADPVVVWNPQRARWWMFYTNRRARTADPAPVAWVHGTRIGIAESADGGASWSYVGEADIELPAAMGGKDATHWAPDVVLGDDWGHPRHIVHLTSTDLRTWRNPLEVKLGSQHVIDASVVKLPGGGWRMWYNNEVDRKAIWYADSPDLKTWTDKGRAVADQAGEGPKVFQWKGSWWMITDVWQGLGVYRSTDLLNWKRQDGNLLRDGGSGMDDQVKGGHADVVVSGGRAYLFYFTHPDRRGPDQDKDGQEQRRSSIQVTELFEDGGKLHVDRDKPVSMQLLGSGVH